MNERSVHEGRKIIEEIEGIRTPTRKRSQKEIETSIADYAAKRSAKKAAKAKPAKAAKSTKTATPKTPNKSPASKSADTVVVATIERIKVTANPGNIVAAGYDEKSQKMHVEFSASVYEYPDTEKFAWDNFHATFADKDVDTGSYFRKCFRGKKFVRVNSPVAAKAAPAKTTEGK